MCGSEFLAQFKVSLSRSWYLCNLHNCSRISPNFFARIGPLFQKYNAVLRFSPKPSPIDENVPSFAKTILEDLGTNRYVSTIHAIQSGVTSMAKISQIPDNRLVYRGVSVNFCTHILFFSVANFFILVDGSDIVICRELISPKLLLVPIPMAWKEASTLLLCPLRLIKMSPSFILVAKKRM